MSTLITSDTLFRRFLFHFKYTFFENVWFTRLGQLFIETGETTPMFTDIASITGTQGGTNDRRMLYNDLNAIPDIKSSVTDK